MSAVKDCVSAAEGITGSLDSDEKKLAELLCAQGVELEDIVATIRLLRWLVIKRQIESRLGRKLTPEEARKARKMHRKGSAIEEICEALDPDYGLSTSITPRPKV